jgi:hypothetical protein
LRRLADKKSLPPLNKRDERLRGTTQIVYRK